MDSDEELEEVLLVMKEHSCQGPGSTALEVVRNTDSRVMQFKPWSGVFTGSSEVLEELAELEDKEVD
jgi:hypothetical protein